MDANKQNVEIVWCTGGKLRGKVSKKNIKCLYCKNKESKGAWALPVN
jgi:hypothetical protein